MGNEEIKKANRKALPKFILLCIVGALIGGVAGYLVGANGIDTMSGDFKVVVSNYVELTAPWIMHCYCSYNSYSISAILQEG